MKILKEYRETLRRLYAEQNIVIGSIAEFLIGRDVILKYGKYRGRCAQIQDYYFDGGREYVRVFIYRLDKRPGFKGREKFIDDYRQEFLEFEDCDLVIK